MLVARTLVESTETSQVISPSAPARACSCSMLRSQVRHPAASDETARRRRNSL